MGDAGREKTGSCEQIFSNVSGWTSLQGGCVSSSPAEAGTKEDGEGVCFCFSSSSSTRMTRRPGREGPRQSLGAGLGESTAHKQDGRRVLQGEKEITAEHQRTGGTGVTSFLQRK